VSPQYLNLVPFASHCPDIAAGETLGLIMRPDSPILPGGRFVFLEHYCGNPNCDCRRVRLEVCSPDAPGKVLATIVWGWEFVEYYAQWTLDLESAEWIVAGYLDPDGAQSDYAEAFADFVRHAVVHRDDWDATFARHYGMFKDRLGPAGPDKRKAGAPCLAGRRIRGQSGPEHCGGGLP